ncbi:MAG: hypothetical protein ACKV2U_18700 [Bryobacteraceae bacterium]
MSAYWLGIDIGTGGSRALLVDRIATATLGGEPGLIGAAYLPFQAMDLSHGS